MRKLEGVLSLQQCHLETDHRYYGNWEETREEAFLQEIMNRINRHACACLRAFGAALAALLLAWALSERAQAQAPADFTVAVQIASFSVDSPGPFKSGDRLQATLTGSPGGRASFAVLNVSGEVPMAEASPGVYTGTLTIPAKVSVAGAAVVGRLVGADGTPAPLLAARQLVTIDNSPPVAYAQTPSPRSDVAGTQPLIFAALSDPVGPGVDPSSIQLFLDGQNVTARSQTSAGFATYRPEAPLGVGNHNVLLFAQDRLGNPMRAAWSFRVSDSDPGLLLSVDTAPAGLAASPSHPLLITLHGPPGRSAACTLPTIARAVPLREISAGTYEGTYSPDPGASCALTPVVAGFKGDKSVAEFDRAVSITADPPPAPSILEPGAQIEISDTLDIAGRAYPGALVLAALAYKSRSDTGLFEIDGTAISAWARADEQGNWKVSGLSLQAPWLLTPDRITRFFVQATAVDSLGRRSQTTVSEVMHS